MTELGKQVWKEMEEMGWENTPEDFYLEYYENIIECTKRVLTIPAVVGRSEQLVCDKCDFVELQGEIYQCTKCYKIEDRLAN